MKKTMAATFNPAAFRVLYPEFKDSAEYPDAVLEVWWGEATGWINTNASTQQDPLPDAQRQSALYMMTAHIGKIGTMLASGEDPGYTTQTSVGKISVTTLAPVAADEFGYWLTTTAYGIKLAAFLRQRTAGGFYVGGSGAIGAYRAPNGTFGGVRGFGL